MQPEIRIGRGRLRHLPEQDISKTTFSIIELASHDKGIAICERHIDSNLRAYRSTRL
jgi:hypothetical protein